MFAHFRYLRAFEIAEIWSGGWFYFNPTLRGSAPDGCGPSAPCVSRDVLSSLGLPVECVSRPKTCSRLSGRPTINTSYLFPLRRRCGPLSVFRLRLPEASAPRKGTASFRVTTRSPLPTAASLPASSARAVVFATSVVRLWSVGLLWWGCLRLQCAWLALPLTRRPRRLCCGPSASPLAFIQLSRACSACPRRLPAFLDRVILFCSTSSILSNTLLS